MDVDEMVDAALVGLNRGETVTIPSLPDIADWEAYEAARQNMIPKLSLSSPALRDAAAVPPETWERLSATASNPVGGSARRLRQRHYWRGRPLDELSGRNLLGPPGFGHPAPSCECEAIVKELST